jgi:hypothetical protein
MKGRHFTARRAATGPAAVIAIAGLFLAGCHSGTSAGHAATAPRSGQAGASASGAAPAGSGQSGNSTTASFTGTSYFPAAVGDTWVYTSSLLTGTAGTVTNKITAVRPAAGGEDVTMAARMSGLPGKPATLTYLFHPDGSITLPPDELGSSISVKSGGILWPSAADLQSGRPHDSTIQLSIGTGSSALNATARVVVRGGGSATVTVPAGTYHATVINEHFAETLAASAKPLSYVVRTWVVSGIGPVKTQAIIKIDGATGLDETETLKSFHRG